MAHANDHVAFVARQQHRLGTPRALRNRSTANVPIPLRVEQRIRRVRHAPRVRLVDHAGHSARATSSPSNVSQPEKLTRASARILSRVGEHLGLFATL